MIWRWALLGLVDARARTAASVLAVAAAFALVMLFLAVWEGETRQLTAYLRHAGADVWVMQSSVSNMHMATSFVPGGKRVEISRLDGVSAVAGILYLNSMVRIGTQDWFSYVVGIEQEGQLGAPWALARGSPAPTLGQAIVPATLARITDTGVGDSIRISDTKLRIAGLSEETFSATNPVTFVHAADLADLLSLHGYDSFLLVRAEPDVDPAALAARIDADVDGVDALTTAELVANDDQLARQMGTETIRMMTALCATLATLLVGFALFIHAAHERKQLATLKAVGFPDTHLYATVLLQSVVLTFTAFLVATVLVGALAALAPSLLPTITMLVNVGVVTRVGLAGVVVAALGAAVVARGVAKVDPMSVFSS